MSGARGAWAGQGEAGPGKGDPTPARASIPPGSSLAVVDSVLFARHRSVGSEVPGNAASTAAVPSASSSGRTLRCNACIALASLQGWGASAMAGITIHNPGDAVRARLRAQADGNGHSAGEEVRRIPRKGGGRAERSRGLPRIIRSHFGPENGVDLEWPERGPAREPPSFE